MKIKSLSRMIVDIAMIVCLLPLMAYQLTGGKAHEWIGAGMFVLLFTHHILNLSWYRNLFRGRYTIIRVIQTVVNMMLTCTTIGLIISGLILSRHVFAFLPIPGSRSFGQTLHHILAYWSFLLMSFHLGLHGQRILTILRKKLKRAEKPSGKVMIRIITGIVICYGIYAFYKHQVGQYMLNMIQYTFFDSQQSIAIFFIDYLSIMGLFGIMAYSLSRFFGKRKKEENDNGNSKTKQ